MLPSHLFQTLLEVEWIAPSSEVPTVKKANRWLVKEFGARKLYTVSNSHLTRGPFDDPEGLLRVIMNLNRYRMFNIINNRACEMFLDSNRALVKQLREEHFDIYFGEQLTLCGTGLSHAIGIPIHFWVRFYLLSSIRISLEPVYPL